MPQGLCSVLPPSHLEAPPASLPANIYSSFKQHVSYEDFSFGPCHLLHIFHVPGNVQGTSSDLDSPIK